MGRVESRKMSKIKLLSDEIINQIAAGEIVERPASALKELIENSIDANAKNIDVFLQNGGKAKIVVQDDGDGIERDDLLMAIQRHATSKLSDGNLFDIESYGFRGEALPSIASVSNLKIESKSSGISVNFSEQSDIFPSAIEHGTKITVQNLFEKLPARLKFLKSDSVELTSCIDVVENISLTKSNINFSLRTEEKQIISFNNDSLESRVAKIFGADTFKKSIYFNENSEHTSVSGYLFHPLENRYSQSFQKIFVNNRIVKDKIVSLAIRNAYKELLPPGRFAIAIIFVQIDPFFLDANVSPTKSEVKFRDPYSFQKFLTESIKKNLHKFDRSPNEIELCTPTKLDFVVENEPSKIHFIQNIRKSELEQFKGKLNQNPANAPIETPLNKQIHTITEGTLAVESKAIAQPILQSDDNENFFGKPIAQIFDAYIITQTKDGIMIIDQHAVHEKITQNKMIKNLTKANAQFLTKPEFLELTNTEIEVANDILPNLKECGFSVEIVQNSLLISSIPAILNPNEAKQYIKDILTDHSVLECVDVLDGIRKKIADKACHNSIRFGRKLSHEEMSAIVHQMEEVPTIHQCNHHRPSFIKISRDQLEKMFHRS